MYWLCVRCFFDDICYKREYYHLLYFIIATVLIQCSSCSGHRIQNWATNVPPMFQGSNYYYNNIVDVHKDRKHMARFEDYCDSWLNQTRGATDGENIDVLEHFFWGQVNGLALELGALDGSEATLSMTSSLEKYFGWHRVLVEGNPFYRTNLSAINPNSFTVSAAICVNHGYVHFREQRLTGGVLDFMNKDFLQRFHSDIYNAGTPPGVIASVDFSQFKDVEKIECIPLSLVLSTARVKHINFFILDVEGGEYSILESIDWESVQFDVLCVETDPKFRPSRYADKVTRFLERKGYMNYSGQRGRNIWYVRNDFIPNVRPGLDSMCFNGVNTVAHYRYNGNQHLARPTQRCPMNSSVARTYSHKTRTRMPIHRG